MALEVLVEHDREDEARLKVLQGMAKEADEAFERGDYIELNSIEDLLRKDK